MSDMDKQFCVYLLANKRNGTLYTGVTSDGIGDPALQVWTEFGAFDLGNRFGQLVGKHYQGWFRPFDFGQWII